MCKQRSLDGSSSNWGGIQIERDNEANDLIPNCLGSSVGQREHSSWQNKRAWGSNYKTESGETADECLKRDPSEFSELKRSFNQIIERRDWRAGEKHRKC